MSAEEYDELQRREEIDCSSMRYIPNSPADRQQMLAEIGVDSIEQLFSGIPEKLRLRRLLDIPKALTEPELLEYFQQRAAQNSVDTRIVYRSRHLSALHSDHHRCADFAVRVLYRLHAVSGRDRPGNAAGDLRIPDLHRAAHRNGSRERVALRRQHRPGRSRADGAPHHARKTDFSSRRPFIRNIAPSSTPTRRISASKIELIDYAADGRVDLGKLESADRRQTSPPLSFSRRISSEPLKTRTTSRNSRTRHGALSIVNVCEAISLGHPEAAGQDSPKNGPPISSSAKRSRLAFRKFRRSASWISGDARAICPADAGPSGRHGKGPFRHAADSC